MKKKQPLRMKDVERSYRDFSDADFKFRDNFFYSYKRRLTLAGFIGGTIGFLLRLNAPEEWGVGSPVDLFVFVVGFVFVGEFVGRVISRYR